MDEIMIHPVMRHFLALTQVPRPSGHTEKVREYLLQFAAENGIDAHEDKAGNIIYRKPATPGMEKCTPTVLQAHFDMVPQKLATSSHNFETDPIETYIDGEWLKAKGTTLGADNGVGVAAAMALFTDPKATHGPLEALFTRDEETGMHGAFGLKEDELQAQIMLNLDTEDYGELIIGCAGGVNIESSLIYKEVETEDEDITIRVSLHGLHGGHSGLEISRGFANANKLMARFLRDAAELYEACLVSWSGGNMHNAIPREAQATLSIMPEMREELQQLVAEYEQLFREEYEGIEEGILFEFAEAPKATLQMPDEIRDNLICSILAVQHGVVRQIPSIPEVVETSNNLAIVHAEAGHCKIINFARSARDSMLDYVASSIESAFDMAGMRTELSGRYSGWDPNLSSPILQLMEKLFLQLEGKMPETKVVHAGLECGIFAPIYPKMDMISFGPTVCSPHTPDERLHLSTVIPFYNYLKLALENIPRS